MTELTVEQLQKQVKQLELKNLELQRKALEEELQKMQVMADFINYKAPILEATLQATMQGIAKRREEMK
jgi:hypothetical protein